MKYLGHDCVEIQVGFFCFTRNRRILAGLHLEHKTLGPRHLWLYNFWDQMDQLFFSSEKTWFCETKSTFDQLLSHIISLNFLLWTLNLSVWLLSKSHLKWSIYWFFCSLDFYLTADLPIPLSWFFIYSLWLWSWWEKKNLYGDCICWVSWEWWNAKFGGNRQKKEESNNKIIMNKGCVNL